MIEVMISIRKKYNDLILSGKKQWEGRKRIPKELSDNRANTMLLGEPIVFFVYEPLAGGGCGKVRYKFESRGAYRFNPKAQDEYEWFKIAKALCVSVDWAKKYYYNSNKSYLIRVENPKIYDKPKELSEFKKSCKERFRCLGCKKNIYCGGNCEGVVERPPQSWQYCQGE